ncbi:hypothetical protein D3C71_1870530 [compost metagenome]
MDQLEHFAKALGGEHFVHIAPITDIQAHPLQARSSELPQDAAQRNRRGFA